MLNNLQKIGAFLWTAYAMFVFILLGSIFFIVEFFLIHLGKFTYTAAHRWPAFCSRVLLFCWGIRVVEHHKEIIEKLPPCIIVINHRSDLDALIATGYMPGIYKFIGKKDLIKYPFIGMLVERLYVTVDRSDLKSRKNSLKEMDKQSKFGANIVVFPEGWSNFSDQYILPLKNGAFKIAIDNQLPIVVATIIGAHERFPKPKIQLTPGEVNLYWETVIPFDENKSIKYYKELVSSIWEKRLKAHYPTGYIYPHDQLDFEAWQRRQLK